MTQPTPERGIVAHSDDPAPREAYVPIAGDEAMRHAVERMSERLAKSTPWRRTRRKNKRRTRRRD